MRNPEREPQIAVEVEREKPETWQVPREFGDYSDTMDFLVSLRFDPVKDEDPVYYRVKPLKGWIRRVYGKETVLANSEWRLWFRKDADKFIFLIKEWIG